MQFSSRLNLASHILLYLATYQEKEKVTSEVLSDTTGANPVNVRKTLCLLKEAGLVQTKPGVGGTSLARDPKDITLADIFDAVEDQDTELFPMHQNPNPNCPVGRTIKDVMENQSLRDFDASRDGTNDIRRDARRYEPRDSNPRDCSEEMRRNS